MKVYLIGNDMEGYCKIGKSEYPEFRAQDIDRPALPFKIWVLAEYDSRGDAGRVEKELHAYFKKKKVRGEWFTFIRPALFLKKAKEFTGSNPKPERTEFPILGKIGIRKWEENWAVQLEKKTPEEKEKYFRGIEALTEEQKILKKERRQNAIKARRNFA